MEQTALFSGFFEPMPGDEPNPLTGSAKREGDREPCAYGDPILPEARA